MSIIFLHWLFVALQSANDSEFLVNNPTATSTPQEDTAALKKIKKISNNVQIKSITNDLCDMESSDEELLAADEGKRTRTFMFIK